jgi:hypothetical protein
MVAKFAMIIPPLLYAIRKIQGLPKAQECSWGRSAACCKFISEQKNMRRAPLGFCFCRVAPNRFGIHDLTLILLLLNQAAQRASRLRRFSTARLSDNQFATVFLL